MRAKITELEEAGTRWAAGTMEEVQASWFGGEAPKGAVPRRTQGTRNATGALCSSLVSVLFFLVPCQWASTSANTHSVDESCVYWHWRCLDLLNLESEILILSPFILSQNDFCIEGGNREGNEREEALSSLAGNYFLPCCLTAMPWSHLDCSGVAEPVEHCRLAEASQRKEKGRMIEMTIWKGRDVPSRLPRSVFSPEQLGQKNSC